MRVQFTVRLDKRPEALAELLQSLSRRGIDLRSIGMTCVAGHTAVVFTTNCDALTHELLKQRRYAFFEGEMLITSVPDQPGAFAEVACRLARAGVTLHGVVLLRWHQGKAELAISVDDPPAARTALAAPLPANVCRVPLASAAFPRAYVSSAGVDRPGASSEPARPGATGPQHPPVSQRPASKQRHQPVIDSRAPPY